MFKRLLFFLVFLQFYVLVAAQCPTILTDDPIEVCESGGTTVNISIEGAVFSTQWLPTIGLNDATILNPTIDFPVDTTYLLTIKGLDADSGDTCLVQKEIEIKVVRYELKIELDTIELSCGDSIRLNAEVIPNGSFFIMEWETEEGHFLRGEQTLRPEINAVGTYKANVIGNLGRIVCRDRDSIIVIPAKAEKLSILPPEKLGCGQSEVTLSVDHQTTSTDFIYQWGTTNGRILSPLDQPNITVNQVGNYTITRTNLFGECTTLTSVEVEEKKEITDFKIIIEELDCESVSSEIFVDNIKDGVGPFQFSIDGGTTFQSAPNFSNLMGGNYVVFVEGSNGCQKEKSISIDAPPIVEIALVDKVEIESGTEFQLPLSVQIDGVEVESIEWSPRIGLSCYDCEQPSLIDNKSRRYVVEVVDENGCSRDAAILVQVKAPNLFYQPSVFSPNGDGQNDYFNVYPNPKFVQQIQAFSISDRYGNLIYTSKGNESGSWDGRYKGRIMPVGTYLYWAVLILESGKTEVINGAVNLVR